MLHEGVRHPLPRRMLLCLHAHLALPSRHPASAAGGHSTLQRAERKLRFDAARFLFEFPCTEIMLSAGDVVYGTQVIPPAASMPEYAPAVLVSARLVNAILQRWKFRLDLCPVAPGNVHALNLLKSEGKLTDQTPLALHVVVVPCVFRQVGVERL